MAKTQVTHLVKFQVVCCCGDVFEPPLNGDTVGCQECGAEYRVQAIGDGYELVARSDAPEFKDWVTVYP